MSKIVIVDDDKDDIYFFLKACKKLVPEPQVVPLQDGKELLAYVETESCQNSIILLDLNMPKMGGLEVLSHLNESGKINNMVVITYSTSDNPNDINKCYELGVKSYITKPDSNKHLAALVDNLRNYWFNINQSPVS